MMPALFISTSSLGKSAFTRAASAAICAGFGDVALDRVELRVFRLYLVEHCLAPPGHDDLVSEFGELERESKSDAGRAPGDEDGAAR